MNRYVQPRMDHDGPSLMCLRSDHDANLNVPAEMLADFSEVYNGPAAEETEH